MKARIALITVLADDAPALGAFYRDVLGFRPKNDVGKYIEFESPGVRFAVCARSVMSEATRHPSYGEEAKGQHFELAFPLDTPEAVDAAYADIIARGALAVRPPATMPWGQRTAFFADPEGNIHELFADEKH